MKLATADASEYIRMRFGGRGEWLATQLMGVSGVANKRAYVFQIRIELLGVEPPIWRRILIPASYSFWDLHVAIQDAMGWQDSHLHSFRLVGSEMTLGIPDPDGFEEVGTHPDWKAAVGDSLSAHSPLALYEYDFGDSWLHELRFECVLEREQKGRYPRCVAGARRCPPEDCGGPHGYQDLLRVLADPTDPEHDSMREWCGDEFDPEAFDAAHIKFLDPAKRWKAVFHGQED